MDLFQAAQDTGRSAVNLAFAIAVCVTTLIILIGVFLLVAPDSVTENDLKKNDESNNVSVGAVTNSLSGPAFGTLLVVVGVVGLAISTWNSISALKKPSVLQMIGLRGIHVHVSSK